MYCAHKLHLSVDALTPSCVATVVLGGDTSASSAPLTMSMQLSDNWSRYERGASFITYTFVQVAMTLRHLTLTLDTSLAEKVTISFGSFVHCEVVSDRAQAESVQLTAYALSQLGRGLLRAHRLTVAHCSCNAQCSAHHFRQLPQGAYYLHSSR